MPPEDEILTVRVTMPGGCPDDFQVFWRGVPIGRIMKATGFPSRDARWSWVISLPRAGGRCGTGDTSADCEAKLWLAGLYLAWAGHLFSASWFHGKLLLVLLLSGVRRRPEP